MHFKALDPDIIRRLITCDEDVLTARAGKRTVAIQASSCPTCKGPLEEVQDPYRAFAPEEVLPRTLAACKACDYLFDPLSGLTLRERLVRPPPE